MSEEQSVLRWGGLAAIVGGVVSILSAILGLAFWPPPPVGPCGAPCFVDESVATFPAVKAAATVGYAAYFAALILLLFLFLALYRALRGSSLAPALFGSVVGIVGLTMLIAGGFPSVAFAHLSDLYHAPGATAQDQATLVLISQGVQAIFNETDAVAGILLGLAFMLLGGAMLRSAHFGRAVGGASLVLGQTV